MIETRNDNESPAAERSIINPNSELREQIIELVKRITGTEPTAEDITEMDAILKGSE